MMSSETDQFLKFRPNLKYIEDDSSQINKIDKQLFLQFKKYKTFIAASTHDDEEIFAAKTHILLKKKNKNFITIIIPRHINRVPEIIDRLEKLGLNIVVRSSKNKKLKNVDIFIVDTFGESKKFYKIKQINLSLNIIFFLYLSFISFNPSKSSLFVNVNKVDMYLFFIIFKYFFFVILTL